jgi:hypothetical protein
MSIQVLLFIVFNLSQESLLILFTLLGLASAARLQLVGDVEEEEDTQRRVAYEKSHEAKKRREGCRRRCQ